MGTPENFKGEQPADFGVGYTGMYLYAPEDYREYVQTQLLETLTKGKKYRISFYVSLAELSNVAIKEFGVLFSKDEMKIDTKKVLSKKLRYQDKTNAYHYLEIGYSNFYSDTRDWILVNTIFEAKGNENYVTIGNFKKNERTRLFNTKNRSGKGAYYYIDMFKVSEVSALKKSNHTAENKKEKTDFKLDKTYLFKNVLFEFDKFQLLEPAKKEIQNLYDYLNSNSRYRITINGYTDAVGNTGYNKDLSQKRAKAVADYLLKMGLSKSRVSWQGYGGETPVATNKTIQGRQKNRRVEFVVTKQ